MIINLGIITYSKNSFDAFDLNSLLITVYLYIVKFGVNVIDLTSFLTIQITSNKIPIRI